MKHDVPLIFERGRRGRQSFQLPAAEVPELSLEEMLPQATRREVPAALPELHELDVVRHYTALSRRNFGVDNGFYPLGSCTMKYNPKIHEEVASWGAFSRMHPLQPVATAQGTLRMMAELLEMLCEICGMEEATLQPAAGAHGEWTGLLMIKAYHAANGQSERDEVLIPDAAHGTNPASAALCGYKAVTVKTAPDGTLDLEMLRAKTGPKTAALMLTNPSTIGKFEPQIVEAAKIVHQAGGQLYYDGANANAIIGWTRPGDMGFDVMHLNLHKTFSTPHGGGGPGSGPVLVKAHLAAHLPEPRLTKLGEVDGKPYYGWMTGDRRSIGRVKSGYGHIGVALRAYMYLRSLGGQGIRAVAARAVLNANYLQQQLSKNWTLAFPGDCMHEFVISARKLKSEKGVRALDVAKRLIDYGVHPPTIYFPLVVEEALMIEPTETESKEELDAFAAMMDEIFRDTMESPEILLQAPQTTPVGRLNETEANRRPVLFCPCAVEEEVDV